MVLNFLDHWCHICWQKWCYSFNVAQAANRTQDCSSWSPFTDSTIINLARDVHQPPFNCLLRHFGCSNGTVLDLEPEPRRRSPHGEVLLNPSPTESVTSPTSGAKMLHSLLVQFGSLAGSVNQYQCNYAPWYSLKSFPDKGAEFGYLRSVVKKGDNLTRSSLQGWK